MSKTLKQICDATSIRAGLGKQGAYFGANDETLAYLANEALHELKRSFNWQAQRTEGTISMTTATSYDLPADLLYIVPNTMNADGQQRFIKFPFDDETFWYFKSNTATGIDYKIRLSGNQLDVLNPDSGIDLIFEYITDNVVTSSGESSPDKAEFTKDTDTCALDDELLIKDLKWRFKAEKGIEGWEKDKMLFNDYLRMLKGQEQGTRSLHFGATRQAYDAEPYTELYVNNP
jgi:hypothetical protein